MGFHEDDRIRMKNRIYNAGSGGSNLPFVSVTVTFIMHDDITLAHIAESLEANGLVVEPSHAINGNPIWAIKHKKTN